MEKRDWLAERWLLRRVRICGFAAPGNETIDAAVRNGAAASRLAGAEALDALLRLGLLEQIDGILFLTREGSEAAEAASRHAAALGEPVVPIPERHLPKIVWTEADFETVDIPAASGTLQPTPTRKEVSMASLFPPEKERFSLDDPDAGRKLIENLDRRRVRLAFSELCWHFRCYDYDEKMRLRSFLLNLEIDGSIVEVLSNLYCRPALTGGTSDAESVAKAEKLLRAAASPKRKAASAPDRAGRPKPVKDVAKRDREAKLLLDFIVARGGTAAASELTAEGERLGFTRNRTAYLIVCLKTSGALESHAYGRYRAASGPLPEASAASGDDVT